MAKSKRVRKPPSGAIAKQVRKPTKKPPAMVIHITKTKEFPCPHCQVHCVATMNLGRTPPVIVNHDEPHCQGFLHKNVGQFMTDAMHEGIRIHKVPLLTRNPLS